MKKFLYWLLAVVITLALSIYQRVTGPTHPKRVTVELRGDSYQLKLPRSGVQKDEIVKLKGLPADAKAQLHYRQYRRRKVAILSYRRRKGLSCRRTRRHSLSQ